MSIVITGGTGFLGRHVTAAIQRLGHEVTPLGRNDGDLLNSFIAHNLLKNASTIVHLAADVGGLGYLRSKPGESFHINHQLGLNAIAASCNGNAKRLILAGTPCGYASESPLPLDEQHLKIGVPSGDTANYAYAKLAITQTAATLCPVNGVEPITVIPANLYGPHDHFDPYRSHVMAALLRKALLARATGQPTFEVWGDGSATRDFVYVEDVASTIALLATDHHPSHAGNTFNLASGYETSMRQLAWTIAGVIGGVKPDFNIDAPVGYSNRVMSIRTAIATLGYEPKVTLEHGIRATVAWVEKSGLLRNWLADASAEAPPTLSMQTRQLLRKTA